MAYAARANVLDTTYMAYVHIYRILCMRFRIMTTVPKDLPFICGFSVKFYVEPGAHLLWPLRRENSRKTGKS